MTSVTARPAELTGRIVLAGDVDYPVASDGYNRLFAHDPAVIVFAQETQDVVNAPAWARQNNVPLRVRSGRHSLEGRKRISVMAIPSKKHSTSSTSCAINSVAAFPSLPLP
jgi:hypothetical protein